MLVPLDVMVVFPAIATVPFTSSKMLMFAVPEMLRESARAGLGEFALTPTARMPVTLRVPPAWMVVPPPTPVRFKPATVRTPPLPTVIVEALVAVPKLSPAATVMLPLTLSVLLVPNTVAAEKPRLPPLATVVVTPAASVPSVVAESEPPTRNVLPLSTPP